VTSPILIERCESFANYFNIFTPPIDVGIALAHSRAVTGPEHISRAVADPAPPVSL
jgi:hypothetical protein